MAQRTIACILTWLGAAQLIAGSGQPDNLSSGACEDSGSMCAFYGPYCCEGLYCDGATELDSGFCKELLKNGCKGPTEICNVDEECCSKQCSYRGTDAFGEEVYRC